MEYAENSARLSLIIITGLSGAGKSLALHRLEDTGFFCADNLPLKLLPGFVEQCRYATPALRQAAVVVDSREAALGTDISGIMHTLNNLDADMRIIFLDCRDEVLLRRYSETRRRHPLAVDGDILTGIQKERAILSPLRDHAHAVIDTSNTTPMALMEKLEEALAVKLQADMLLSCISFGYKRGVPFDADIVFDMRFLTNPFYESALRNSSGIDKPVQEFILQDPAAGAFFDMVEQLLLLTIPGFAKQGKQHVVVAFGCTGGRHRSVFAAEEMSARLLARQCHVRCQHRDYQKEKADILSRFTSKEENV